MADRTRVTVIVLVARETNALGRWHDTVAAALEGAGSAPEFVYAVSDRCPDAVAELERLRATGRTVSLVLLSHWFERAAAVQRALGLGCGEQVLVLPAGGDVDPDQLSALVAALDDHDVALARRDDRMHAMIDRLARRLFGTRLGDPACATRAFRRDALIAVGDRSVPYGLMPLLASWQGFAVTEVTVRPAARAVGAGSALAGASHAVALVFLHVLLGFAKRPLQLFGAVGAAALVAGALITLPLIAARLFFGEALADEPGLLPGLLLTALGVQCVAVGLLAELLVFARNRMIKDDVVERMVE